MILDDTNFDINQPPEVLPPRPVANRWTSTSEHERDIHTWEDRQRVVIAWFRQALDYFAERAFRRGCPSAEDLQRFCRMPGNPFGNADLGTRINEMRLARKVEKDKRDRRNVTAARVYQHA